MALNLKGVVCWKSLAKHLIKFKEDVENEVFIEVPEIGWTKPKNLPHLVPRLDQLTRFFDEG